MRIEGEIVMFTSYSGIKADIQDSSLILTADKTGAKLALGSGSRIINILDISATSITLPSGLKNGVIKISDATGRSELAFLKKHLVEATSFFQEISSICPNAVDAEQSSSLWPKAIKKAADSLETKDVNSTVIDIPAINTVDFGKTRGKNLWNTTEISLYETTIASRTFTGKIKKEFALSELKHISYIEPKGLDAGSVSVIDKSDKSHKISGSVKRFQYEELCTQLSKHSEAVHISTALSERSGFKVSAINQEFIGSMKAESLLNRMNSDSKERIGGSGGHEVKVYKTFISQNGQNYFFDEFVSAELIVHGQIQVTHRPTLTRMALTSALPGPALAWGLALAKPKKHDSRQVIFTCTHPEWSISLNVDPDQVANAKSLTMRINSICERIADSKTS